VTTIRLLTTRLLAAALAIAHPRGPTTPLMSQMDASVLASQAHALRERLFTSTIPGSNRVLSRVDGEMSSVTSSASTTSRLHGAANNLAAVEWELDVLDCKLATPRRERMMTCTRLAALLLLIAFPHFCPLLFDPSCEQGYLGRSRSLAQ
jgi:hypothetical protein